MITHAHKDGLTTVCLQHQYDDSKSIENTDTNGTTFCLLTADPCGKLHQSTTTKKFTSDQMRLSVLTLGMTNFLTETATLWLTCWRRSVEWRETTCMRREDQITVWWVVDSTELITAPPPPALLHVHCTDVTSSSNIQ